MKELEKVVQSFKISSRVCKEVPCKMVEKTTENDMNCILIYQQLS